MKFLNKSGPSTKITINKLWDWNPSPRQMHEPNKVNWNSYCWPQKHQSLAHCKLYKNYLRTKSLDTHPEIK